MAQRNTANGSGQLQGRRRQKIDQANAEPETYVSGRKINFRSWIIPASAVLTGTLVSIAAPQLVEANGILGVFKIALIGSAAAFVSGIVNHYSIKEGSELAGRGFRLASLASLIPVIVVGASAATFSYSGLVLNQVNELNRQEHAQRLGDYIEAANAHAVQFIQIKPIVDSAAKDIQLNLDCEKAVGCLSDGRGGEGPIYRAVLPLASRAEEISRQLEISETFRKNQLSNANKLVGEYQTILTDRDLSSIELAQALSRKDARIKQDVSALREGMPVSLVTAYGSELEGGIAISGKPEATGKVNAMLRRHGASIGSAIESLKVDKSVSPAFPSKAGVSQAFERFSSFWPIGVLTFSIEMLIPITLWVFAYLAMVWQLYKSEHKQPRASAAYSRHALNGRFEEPGRSRDGDDHRRGNGDRDAH